jgi:long-chain fatty acid transport protein
MRTGLLATVGAVVVAGLLAAVPMQATNGYFGTGYGTKSQGMGGAGVAFPLGPIAPATNPASLAVSKPGFEIGGGLFNPNRRYEVVGNPSGYPGTFGLAPGKIESDSPLFVMPHIGVSKQVGSAVTIGLAAYGNGGMNTDYNAPTFAFSPTGINMSQLFVAPTVAVKLSEQHAIGVSAILGYQMFKAEGLQAFGMFSSDPKNLTGNDTDSAMGAGVRVGYIGQLSKYLSVGASWQSKVYMSEFKKYAGLFAEGGDFDVPSNWTVGLGVKPTENLDLAVDVQQMRYSEIASVGNPMLPNLMQAPLGADKGAGFGWRDVTVVKAGLEHRAGSGFAWRAGYSYGEQPIPSSEVLFNILAPGVIEQHATLGFSKTVGDGKWLDVAATRAFDKKVSGPNPLEVPGRQTIELSMDQWVVTVGFSMNFR